MKKEKKVLNKEFLEILPLKGVSRFKISDSLRKKIRIQLFNSITKVKKIIEYDTNYLTLPPKYYKGPFFEILPLKGVERFKLPFKNRYSAILNRKKEFLENYSFNLKYEINNK